MNHFKLILLSLTMSVFAAGCAPGSSDCGLLCAEEEKEKVEQPSVENTLAFEFVGGDFSVNRHRKITVPIGLSGSGSSESVVTLGVDVTASTSATDLDDLSFTVGANTYTKDNLELTFVRPSSASNQTIEIDFPADMSGIHNISLALYFETMPTSDTPPIGPNGRINFAIDIGGTTTDPEPEPTPLTLVKPTVDPVRVAYPMDTDYFTERASDVVIELEGGDGNYTVTNNCPSPVPGCAHGYYGDIFPTGSSNVFVYRPYVITGSEFLNCAHPVRKRCPMPRSAKDRVQITSSGSTIMFEVFAERDWGY